MTDHTTLRQLDEAHDEAARAVRERIDEAEECVAYYRRQMSRMQETFHELASRRGVADDPGFRSHLHRAVDEADDDVRRASHRIAEWEAELAELTAEHAREREDLLREG